MKCIIKPQEEEQAIHYSDFSGKLFKDFIPVTVKIDCTYGSKYDGANAEFHLSDRGLELLLAFLKQHLCDETKAEFKRLCRMNDDNKQLFEKLI
jgi:hypothetical protein